MNHLPHDDYMGAVTDALTNAGLAPFSLWTSDAETRGTYCYLSGAITLDPSDSQGLDVEDIPAGARWPHGLLLLWEWHTGAEADQGEPEKGPVWQFAEVNADGSNAYPTDLPVYGYAAPSTVVEAVQKVIDGEIGPDSFYGLPRFGPLWDGGVIGGVWEHADVLDAACEAWAGEVS